MHSSSTRATAAMSGRQSSSRGRSGGRSGTQERGSAIVKVSKSMSRILRHDPPPSIDPSGWVPLPDLMQKMRGSVSLEQIQVVVESDEKGRFEVRILAADNAIQ